MNERDRNNEEKIISFDDKKKSKEQQGKDASFDAIEMIKRGMREMGYEAEEEMILQLEEQLKDENTRKMLNDLLSGQADPNEVADSALRMSSHYQNEYRFYREYKQWRQVYRPYTLSSILLDEEVRKLSEDCGVPVATQESKNTTLQKLLPELVSYLEKTFRLFEKEQFDFFYQLIREEGRVLLRKPLTDIEEKKIDVLQQQGLVFRILEDGERYLVLPKEIHEGILQLNFVELEEYMKVNQTTVRLSIAFCNCYGVVSREDLYHYLWEQMEDVHPTVLPDRFSLIQHTNQLLEASFGSLFDLSYFQNISYNRDYIFHSLVAIPKEFVEMRGSFSDLLKQKTPEEYMLRSDAFYYEDTMQLTTCYQLISQSNEIGVVDELVLKNLLYISSQLEFEPNMILDYLKLLYRMPTGKKYDEMLIAMNSLYKISPKWLLGGLRMGEKEADEKGVIEKEKIAKIINVNFLQDGNAKKS